MTRIGARLLKEAYPALLGLFLLLAWGVTVKAAPGQELDLSKPHFHWADDLARLPMADSPEDELMCRWDKHGSVPYLGDSFKHDSTRNQERADASSIGGSL